MNLCRLFFQPACEDLHPFLLLGHYRFQLLYFAVLLEKLVEQHCVYCFVAHGERFPLVVADNQIRIYFFYVLSHQPELRCGLRIDFLLVAERNGLQCEDRFVGFVHPLNILFVSSGGLDRAELAIGVDEDAYPAIRRFAVDAGDKRPLLCPRLADANGIRIASGAEHTSPNNDIIAAGGKIETGSIAQRNVEATSSIVKECIDAAGRVCYCRLYCCGVR